MPLSSKFRVVVFLIHEGPRRTATSFGPRRARRTATATSFCPRRAAKGHEGPRRTATAERQRQLLFVHGGPRRTPLFDPRGTRRATKNGNGNTFVRGGHGGPRRTATAELQLQLLFVHEAPRRTAKYTSIYPRRSRRTTKNGNGNTFVRGGHGGPRRTAFVVAADRGRRARESGGKRPDSAHGRVKERRENTFAWHTQGRELSGGGWLYGVCECQSSICDQGQE